MAASTQLRESPGPLIGPGLQQRAARASLRAQISRLERRLAAATMELWESRALEPAPRSRAVSPSAGRLLSLGELEAVRDELVTALGTAERALEECADSQAEARARLDAMLAEPARHRYAVVRRAELGEPSCGAYHVLPRLGLLGMLFGWWCVKLSSGCP